MLLFLLMFYPTNLRLKFGQNCVSKTLNVVVKVIVIVVVIHVVVVDPRKLPLKFS